MFGATTGEEGNFSQYEGRDVELDPVAPITCVLTVAYVPPEEPPAVGVTAGRVASYAAAAGVRAAGAVVAKTKPRVCCFLADGQAQSPPYASASFVDDWEGLPPVWMEVVLPREKMNTGPAVSAAGVARGCSSAVGGGDAGMKGRKCCCAQMKNDAGAFKGCSIHKGNNVCAGRGTSRARGGSKPPRPRYVDRGEYLPTNEQPKSARSCDRGGGGDDDGATDSGWSGSRGGAEASGASGLKRPSVEGGNTCPSRGGGAAANDTTVAAALVQGSPCYPPRLLGGGSSRCRPRALSKLREPSSAVPLEDADTILLIGTHLDMLDKTSAWLGNALPNAVILGGLSNCSLVVGNQVCFGPS